jgi:hypothetical protein
MSVEGLASLPPSFCSFGRPERQQPGMPRVFCRQTLAVLVKMRASSRLQTTDSRRCRGWLA